MNQEDRDGFFYQYFIACFRPSSYDRLLGSGRGLAPYLLFLFMVLVLIKQAIPMLAWDVSVGGLNSFFTERVPAFRVEKGVLTCEKPMEFQIGQTFHFQLDADRQELTQSDLSGDYVQEILVGRTSVLVKNGMTVRSIRLAEIGDSVFDNQSLVHAIPLIRIFMLLYLVLAYLETAIEYLVVSLFYLLIGRTIIRGPDGKSVTWKQGFRIAVYARTLMSLVSGVNMVVGYLIGATVMDILTAGVSLYYMTKAERAVLGVKPRGI